MWRLEKTGKLGTADQKISELFALLAESRAYQESETRWAHQYKTERDACVEDLRCLLEAYDDRRAQWGSDPLWVKHEDVKTIDEIRSRRITAVVTYADGTKKHYEGYGYPRRIQRKRTKGWTMPANTVSVCRPGKWGNPFQVADVLDHYDGDKIAAQADCVRSYRRWIDEGVTGFFDDGPPCISEIRRALAGKNLACWCKQGTPCHADVLLGLANVIGEAAAACTPKIDQTASSQSPPPPCSLSSCYSLEQHDGGVVLMSLECNEIILNAEDTRNLGKHLMEITNQD